MKIGITALSFDAVMHELVGDSGANLSSFRFSSYARRAAERGFRHVELTLDMYHVFPESLSKDNIEELRRLKEEEGMSFSAHLPIWSMEPSSHVEEIRTASVSAILRTVDEVEALSPDPYVLHATGPLAAEFHRLRVDPNYKGIIAASFAVNARRSLEQVVEAMGALGVSSRRVALESVEFPFRETIQLAKELRTSVCVDTGHVLAGYPGDVNVQQALTLSAGILGEVHLHDGYRKVSGDCIVIRDHLPLGSGNLDLREFVNVIESLSFDGPIVFELALGEAEESLRRLHECISSFQVQARK